MEIFLLFFFIKTLLKQGLLTIVDVSIFVYLNKNIDVYVDIV